MRKTIEEYLFEYKKLKKECLKDDRLIDILKKILQYDAATWKHSLDVMLYCVKIGEVLGLKEKELVILAKAALLHDVGKLFIPIDILNKKNSLTENEFYIIKNHPVTGALFLFANGFNVDIILPVFEHHEKLDGTGYPRGNYNICLKAQIISVADIYNAITSDRPYHKGLTCESAIITMNKDRGTKYNPELLDILFQITRRKAR